MKKQIMFAAMLLGIVLVSNETLAYSWNVLNLTNYPINAVVNIACGSIKGQWKTVNPGQTYTFNFSGGAAGCTGPLMVNDYVKANNLGNIEASGTVTGYNVLYCGYYPTNDQATLNGNTTYTAAQLSQHIGVNTQNFQLFPNWNGITWSQSGGKCPQPAN